MVLPNNNETDDQYNNDSSQPNPVDNASIIDSISNIENEKKTKKYFTRNF